MMVLDGISIILYHPRLNLAQGVHPGPDLICKEYKKGVGKFNEIFWKWWISIIFIVSHDLPGREAARSFPDLGQFEGRWGR